MQTANPIERQDALCYIKSKYQPDNYMPKMPSTITMNAINYKPLLLINFHSSNY